MAVLWCSYARIMVVSRGRWEGRLVVGVAAKAVLLVAEKSIPLRRNKVHFDSSPACGGDIRPLPCVSSSAQRQAFFAVGGG